MRFRMLLVAVALAGAAGLAAEDALGIKAQGVPTSKYGAATAGIVCGDRLCSEPPPPEPEPEPRPEVRTDPALRELAPNVYVYSLNNYNSLVVVADDGVMVVDTVNEGHSAMMKEAIATVTAAPVTYAVMSHEHYDHAGGASVFDQAQVICQANCLPIFELDPLGISPEVDIVFDDYMAVDMGGITVEMWYLGPGDGDATTVVYLPDEQILFTADLYESRELTHSMFLDDSNSTGRQKILNTVSEWPLRYAVNSHSEDDSPQALHDNAAFLNDLSGAVMAAVQSSDKEGLAAVIETYMNPGSVDLPQYSDWDGYDEHFSRHVERMVMSLFHGD